MQDSVGFCWFLLQLSDGLFRRQDHEFDFAALGFLLHLIHHRQGAGAGTDDEPSALPGYGLLWRNRRVPEGFTECFGWFFLPLADPAAVDHHVVLVGRPVHAD